MQEKEEEECRIARSSVRVEACLCFILHWQNVTVTGQQLLLAHTVHSGNADSAVTQ